MASFCSSPQERSITSPKVYDAFISHRGPDVKDTLAKELYELLKARQCRAFLDREEIEGGDSIPSAIHDAICSSFVQIAIFSQGYAASKWCLDELVLMLQQTDAMFIPVFYDVEPWHLRHIENENSPYAAAFSHYQSKGRYLDKLDEWKKALESAADISGYERRLHQDNLCEKIVSRVLQETDKRRPLNVAEHPVGVAELVQDFESCCSETVKDKVKIVGIYGLGGSGKTTLAKELLNKKRSGYHASCFLSDVRESDAKGELHCLQNQLLKDLFGEDRKFRNIAEGIGQLKQRLGSARHFHFLIVLDDVDGLEQLGALLFEGMLSPGSLVIITTRDQSVLTGTDINYRMKGMDWHHAKELFCSHAFRRRDPPIAYEKLVESFVKFCGGLPLSLKVLGSHVYGKNVYNWELELKKVKDIQPKDIMQRLKISFDGLDSQEKQIFIDIACFCNKRSIHGLKKKAISIWKASGWSAEHAVQTLQNKCLVEVVSHKFEMHDHLRDLGRQMADDLSRPPRLWRPEILRSMEASGFKQILEETKGRCFHWFKDLSLETRITYFLGSSNDSAETDLLLLEINKQGGKSIKIPSWIPLRKLHYLHVHRVEELWSTFQQQLQTNTQGSFELRMLEIYDCRSLQNLPDLLGMFNHLEELYISGSFEKTDITSFVQSLKQLSKLRSLGFCGSNFSFCGDLNLSKDRGSTNFKVSKSSRMNSLETIYFQGLHNISKLVISGEICPRLQSLKVGGMGILNEMDLKQLERLNTLEMVGCHQLKKISGLPSLTGLQSLNVRECPELKTISELSSLTRLQVFKAQECGRLESLPTFADLRQLERITIFKCHQLQSIEGFGELQGLKSLAIEVPDNGYAWVRNCINGVRTLPSEYTFLTGKAVDRASTRLNVNLFSEVIGAPAVTEIRRVEDKLEMRSSSNAITIYALLVTSNVYPAYITLESVVGHLRFLPRGAERMITVLLTPDKSHGRLWNIKIKKAFVATVNEGEEGKALTILQTIVDRLYGQSMIADDVGTDESDSESESKIESESESESGSESIEKCGAGCCFIDVVKQNYRGCCLL